MLTSLLFMVTPMAVDAASLEKVLFANEGFYKSQEGKEREFVGTLKMIKRPDGVVGFGRFNPYYLVMKNDKREVYVGGKPDVLKPYVDKRVKFLGKAVDLEVEGTNHREIWPASIVALGKAEDNEGSVKVIGRAYWRASARPGGKPQQLVIRSEQELTKALPGKGAAELLAKQFKVDKIDFDKQMIIVATAGAKPTGGYRVEITDLAPKGETLTVAWKLHSPKPGSIVTQAFTHPAEAVLVLKHEGKVVFEPSLVKRDEDK